MNSNSIAVVLGTRPEIIKLAAVIRGLGEDASVIFTCQHYDSELAEEFFRSFELPQPELRLSGISGADRGLQISRAIDQLVNHFRRVRPSVVIVQGDTNSTSAGAQAANYCEIPLLHVEAGLRSHDRSMPEEINRRVVSILADVHCAPTSHAADNLISEGVPSEKILITGNTIVEATWESLPEADKSLKLLKKYRLRENDYILATIHRPENTDNKERLSRILDELSSLPLPVILPVHPRTAARAKLFDVSHKFDRISIVSPLGHADFLGMARHARLIISDSGGIQEECTVIKKPLIVIRNNTERPEAFAAGFAVRAVGNEISKEVSAILSDSELQSRLEALPSPFGDGRASMRILQAARAMARGEDLPFINYAAIGQPEYARWSPRTYSDDPDGRLPLQYRTTWDRADWG